MNHVVRLPRDPNDEPTLTQETLHRTLKLALDTGEATSLAEAEKQFAGYRLAISIGPDVAKSPTLQAMILTAINTGRRCFLGGVTAFGHVDVPLRVSCPPWRTLSDAIVGLQGRIGTQSELGAPLVVIGDLPSGRRSDLTSTGPIKDTARIVLRATYEGWTAGVSPLATNIRLSERQEFIPAGVLAGALAVSEAFQAIRESNRQAGQRVIGMSLWRPESSVSWQDSSAVGPIITSLPSKLWMIGLGHLGQAFLWTLGMLPYEHPEDVLLVLQDVDVLVQANDSTSLLTDMALIGQQKTRAMAYWAEARGFRTHIVERRFDQNFSIAPDEPAVAVCGVDNPNARAVLGDVGFQRIIEAGLGADTQEYLGFQLHTFPSSRTLHDVWDHTLHEYDDSRATLEKQPAYQRLLKAGFDPCGITTLAGRTVGASFVGAVTSALMIAETLRLTMNAHAYEVIDGTLRGLEYRDTILNTAWSNPFNPGIIPARC